MKFNENSRVKIPSILHLTRLGYEYISLKDTKWDEETNIFKDILLLLDNDDLEQARCV